MKIAFAALALALPASAADFGLGVGAFLKEAPVASIKGVLSIPPSCCGGDRITLARLRAGESVVNNDGSVTVLEPSLIFGEGRKVPISAASDWDGVCKLYNLGPNRTAAGRPQAGPATVIDREGSGTRMTDGMALSAIVCEPGEVQPAKPLLQDRAQEVLQINQGTLIVKPFVLGPGKAKLPLQAPSGAGALKQLDGICAYFGFKSNRLYGEGPWSKDVAVVSGGKLANIQGYEGMTIDALLCR